MWDQCFLTHGLSSGSPDRFLSRCMLDLSKVVPDISALHISPMSLERQKYKRKRCNWLSAALCFFLQSVGRNFIAPVWSLVSIFNQTGWRVAETKRIRYCSYECVCEDKRRWVYSCLLASVKVCNGPLIISAYLSILCSITAGSYFTSLPCTGLSALSDWIRLHRADWTP